MKSSTYYYGKIHCLSTGTTFSGRAGSSGGLRKCFRGFSLLFGGRRSGEGLVVGKRRGETASQNQGSYAPFVAWGCFQLGQHETHNITLSRSKQTSASSTETALCLSLGANDSVTVLFSCRLKTHNTDNTWMSSKAHWTSSTYWLYLGPVFRSWPVHDYNPYSFSLH